MRFLIALDLDGTAVDDEGNTTPELLACMERLSRRASLVYATGRTLDAAVSLVNRAGLPEPDHLVCDVGNRVYHSTPGGYEIDVPFERFNKAMWSFLAVEPADVTGRLGAGVEPQTGSLVRRLGFWAQDEAAAVREAASLRGRPGVSTFGTVRWGGPTTRGAWWIDVLPRCAGKGTAVGYLAFCEGIPASRVLAIGDSLNDVDMLDGRFRGAVPANATPRLVAELRSRGHSPHISSEPGPRGAACALSALADALPCSEEWPAGADEKHERVVLECFRRVETVQDVWETVAVWPDRLRNWGLRPGKTQPASNITTCRIKPVLQRGRNCWWETAGREERCTILQRVGAIPVGFLLDKLQRYVSEKHPGTRLLGGMVSGSYVYGSRNGHANDLDLVLLLEGLRCARLGFEIDLPGLRDEFADGLSARLRTDRVGLGLLNRDDLNARTTSSVVLQLAASMETTGLPLFGAEATDAPMPAFDVLCQAGQLLKDAQMSMEAEQPDWPRRVSMRCEEARRAVRFAAQGLNLACSAASETVVAQPKVGVADEGLLRRHRQLVAETFLSLVPKLVGPPAKAAEVRA